MLKETLVERVTKIWMFKRLGVNPFRTIYMSLCEREQFKK